MHLSTCYIDPAQESLNKVNWIFRFTWLSCFLTPWTAKRDCSAQNQMEFFSKIAGLLCFRHCVRRFFQTRGGNGGGFVFWGIRRLKMNVMTEISVVPPNSTIRRTAQSTCPNKGKKKHIKDQQMNILHPSAEWRVWNKEFSYKVQALQKIFHWHWSNFRENFNTIRLQSQLQI